MARRPRSRIEETRQQAETEIGPLWRSWCSAHGIDRPSEHDALIFFQELERGDRRDLANCWPGNPWRSVLAIIQRSMYPDDLAKPGAR
jgi:hypothetical protein